MEPFIERTSGVPHQYLLENKEYKEMLSFARGDGKVTGVAGENFKKLGKFLNSVERVKAKIMKRDNTLDAQDIARKLCYLAENRINNKESQWWVIHRFFHRIGQLFQGHGFRTKGEYSLKVAKEIARHVNQIVIEDLRSGKISNEWMKVINKSSKECFIRHMQKAFLSTEEKFTLADHGIKKVYKLLSEEKLVIFRYSVLNYL